MKSIRHQLTRDLFLALSAVAILVSVGMYVVFWEMMMESFDGKLRAQSLAVQSLTEFEDGQVQYDFSADFLASYGGAKARNFFQLWDTENRVLTRSDSMKQRDLPWRPGKKNKTPGYSNVELPNGRSGRMVSTAFVPTVSGDLKGKSVPTVYASVAADREELDESLVGLMLAALVGLVLMIAALLLIVPRVLRRGLRPMEQLTERAAAIHADSLGIRFATLDLPAELKPVSERLNDLLARLEASFERERRFSADLAHELRTPLSELRSMAECALKWPDQRDPAFEQDTLLIARHMETLVTHLLSLARGEQGTLTLSIQSLDLPPFVTTAWEAFAARAAEKHLRVTVAAEPGVLASADPALLRAILINLFDNAISYTPEAGEISLAVSRRETGALIQIANGPVDLSEADVKKIFDRFWRKESSRTDKAHFGLGLSLCRSFATSIDWNLSASLDGQRLVISLDQARR